MGLVDGDGVGEFHDAALDPLQLVAGTRELQQQEEVDHAGHRHFRLADADGLYQDDVVAGGLADQQGLAGLARHPAEGVAGRGRADEGVGIAGELLHPGLVAQDAPSGALRGGVDGEHRDLVAARREVEPEGLDEGALAGAGNPGDADADAVAGERQELVQQGGGRQRMIGAAALDQGDGLGQRPPLAGANPFDDVVELDHRSESLCNAKTRRRRENPLGLDNRIKGSLCASAPLR